MRINWGIIRFLVVSGLLVFLFSFSNQRNESRKLTKIEIDFLDENSTFITLNSVNKLLIVNNDSITNIGKETLDLNDIEQRLQKNPMIKKADVFVSINGVLGAKIKQPNPVARIIAKQDYYLDEDGGKMPLSKVTSARVPLVTGKVKDNYKAIIQFLKIVNKDGFMKKSVIGIHLQENGDMMLKLRKQNFALDLGKPIDVEEKFYNYKAFYKKAKLDNTLTSYSLIDLKYKKQVVATKR